MKITVHTTTSVFDELKPEWDRLVQNSISNTPFSTWDWVTTWWAAYQPGQLWLVTARLEDGTLVAIAPWFLEEADGKTIIRFIGHIDVVDYMDLIVDQEHIEPCFEALAGFLVEHQAMYDQLGIANIPASSPTYTRFPEHLKAHNLQVSIEQNDVAPQIQLPPDYDTYLKDILSSRERKETRRKMRKAEGGLYDVQWYRVDDTHDLSTELAQFLALMRSADEEKAAFLENAQHVDFFQRVMPKMYQAGHLDLLFVTIDGTACAAYLNLDYNNHIYVYNSGLDASQYGALSPGIVLLQYAIQNAIEKQRSLFDFLRGDESYKYKMGGTDTSIYQINAHCS